MPAAHRMNAAATVSLIAACLLAAQQTPPKKPIDVPYVHTPNLVVEGMLKLAGVTKDDVIYDLGCGDGRIVITAARLYGARGVGIDIDPERVAEARTNAAKEGVENLAKFEEKDLFEADIHDATVVTIYLLPSVNRKLRPKLLKDLKPGTRIVSNTFDMGDWKPVKEDHVDGRHLYFWSVPAKP
jgi:SAM-dependent methyltransferase